MDRTFAVFVLGIATILSPANAQCPDNSPPSGPITYQGKPLSQIEPRVAINACNTPGSASATFVISSPGSYYLTGSFNGTAGKVGILVNAPDVTIDMQGFTMYGALLGTYGITANPGNNVRILNGHIGGWTSGGINAPNTTSCRVERVSVTGCTGRGIRLGNNSIVESCHVDNTQSGAGGPGDGIVVGAGSRVSGCVLNGNAGTALDLGARSSASGCTLAFNAGVAVNMSTGASLRDCTIEYSLQDGVVCADSCTVSGCTITRSGSPTVLRSGIYVPAVNCSIRDNTLIGAGTTNGYGIAAFARARIERNHCVNHGTGIIVDGTGNFVLSNTGSGNATNFSVASGNIFSSTSSSTSTAQGVNYSLP